MPRHTLPTLFPLLLACSPLFAAAGGCARYAYDVVRPEEFAGRAGRGEDFSFERGPLRYLLRTVDNRLVMRIYNPGDKPITLLGRQSTVVDPEGQSRPLGTQTLAPQSFVKLIFPPLRARLYRNPRFGIGIGVGARVDRDVGRLDSSGYPIFDDTHDAFVAEPEPLFLLHQSPAADDDVELDGGLYYWEWDGEGEIRLTLVFDRASETLTHDFLLRRVRT